MNHLQTFAAAPALALCLVLAAPALAQQAPAQPAAATNQAASNGRTVSGRELMTREERASFRRQIREATPEQRQQLWTQKRAELAQRAAARGLVLAEPGSRAGANLSERGGKDGGRGEGGGFTIIRVIAPPRAP